MSSRSTTDSWPTSAAAPSPQGPPPMPPLATTSSAAQPTPPSPSDPPVPLVAHMNEAMPNLWIGDIVAATDGALLARARVREVVSVVRGEVGLPADVKSHVIAVDDDDLADLLSHLPKAVELVRAGLERGGVLVHCQAGMSRSATIVAAYLMSTLGLSREDALAKIRTARPCIQPSETFLAQLAVWEAAGHRVSAEDAGTRAWFRERMQSDLLAGRSFGSSSSLLARLPAGAPPAPAPAGTTVYRNRKLRCASCRRDLALHEHVLHRPPSSSPPDDASQASPESYGTQATITAGHSSTSIVTPPPILDPNSPCSGYFVEPMGWMHPLLDGSAVAGKLLCPNARCRAKLGNYDWAGQKCGCKGWVVPGFCLTRAKVDDISY